jgi:hypothetical protein
VSGRPIRKAAWAGRTRRPGGIWRPAGDAGSIGRRCRVYRGAFRTWITCSRPDNSARGGLGFRAVARRARWTRICPAVQPMARSRSATTSAGGLESRSGTRRMAAPDMFGDVVPPAAEAALAGGTPRRCRVRRGPGSQASRGAAPGLCSSRPRGNWETPGTGFAINRGNHGTPGEAFRGHSGMATPRPRKLSSAARRRHHRPAHRHTRTSVSPIRSRGCRRPAGHPAAGFQWCPSA